VHTHINSTVWPILKPLLQDYPHYRADATDPRGGITKFTYGLRDTTYTYPDWVINPLGQTTNVSYFLSTGNMNYTVDPNGYKTLYNYDVFGRLSSVVKVGDTAALPSVEYAYFIDGVAPEGVRIKARINSGASATFDSVSFVDGFGRQIQSRIDAEPAGQQVVSNRFYDGTGRASAESVPYFASYGNYSSPDLSARNVSHQYDAQDREIKTVNTDNTYKTILYRLWNVTFTDENGHSRIQSKDAFDRITDVYELNG